MMNLDPAAVGKFGDATRAVTAWLRRIPSWRNGSNFVVSDSFATRHWGDDFCASRDPGCRQSAAFVSDDAMVRKTDTHCRAYRPYYDIAMPLPLDWMWAQPEARARGLMLRSALHLGDGAAARRELVFFFKGRISRDRDGGRSGSGEGSGEGNGEGNDGDAGNEEVNMRAEEEEENISEERAAAKVTRRALLALHEPARGFVCVETGTALGDAFAYADSLAAARFAAVPYGSGLHSYRLVEAMHFGAVPVFLVEGYVRACLCACLWAALRRRRRPRAPGALLRHVASARVSTDDGGFARPVLTAVLLLVPSFLHPGPSVRIAPRLGPIFDRPPSPRRPHSSRAARCDPGEHARPDGAARRVCVRPILLLEAAHCGRCARIDTTEHCARARVCYRERDSRLCSRGAAARLASWDVAIADHHFPTFLKVKWP